MHFDPERATRMIETFIIQQMEHFQREGAVLGLSGGIDSSLVATLLVRALGPDQVLALLLPERDSHPSSKSDALREIERLGINHREINLTPLLSALGIYKLLPLRILGTRRIKEGVVRQQHEKQEKNLGEMPFLAGLLGTQQIKQGQKLINAGNAYTRAKHRARLLTLYYVADLENRLVVGTTNKSESLSGFVVKWGDNVADIEPILPLYKTQVRELAAHLGVPAYILDKPPSPDLLPGIVDEYALGVDYPTLDQILFGLEENWGEARLQETTGGSPELIAHVRELYRRSRHMRELPPQPDLASCLG